MRLALFLAMLTGWLSVTVSPARAIDAFDRHTLAHLRTFGKEAKPLADLTARQAAEWKMLAPGFTTPAIVIKTDSGNWVKALVSWGLRKGPEKPTPVLLIERYVTFDATRSGVTTASGKDVMLFPGFGYDFDIGQVVPAGFGADIEFTAERKIRPAEGVQLFGLDGPAIPPAARQPNVKVSPTDHDGILPEDFAGQWKLNADGRWRGILELHVDKEGNVDGQYISDETQSSYKVIGKVDSGSHRVVLEVSLANSDQSYEGYLWTTDKSTFAGITTLSERRFGFYAVRHVEGEEGEQP